MTTKKIKYQIEVNFIMKLTKDEARILASALNDFKFSLYDNHHIDGLFSKLENLEDRLERFGIDKRRTGRTSQNDFSDLIKRFAS